MKRRTFLENTLMVSAGLTFHSKLLASERLTPNVSNFKSDWHTSPDRLWLGPGFWANRLQDWQIKEGGVESVIRGKNRSIAILTHELGEQEGDFEIKVDFKFLDFTASSDFVGFRIGNKGPIDDYRSAAIYGRGIKIGVNSNGQLTVGEKTVDTPLSRADFSNKLTLVLTGKPLHNNVYKLDLAVINNGKVLQESTGNLLGKTEIVGGITLLNDCQTKEQQVFTPGVRFENLQISGSKLIGNEARTFGPIYFAQYTLHHDCLKLSAQTAPIGSVGQEVILEVQEKGQWRVLAKVKADPISRVAAFRIENWQKQEVVPYRLKSLLATKTGSPSVHYYEGSFAPAPKPNAKIKLGLFSCNCDHGFPDTDLRKNMLYHQIDAALFLGDQFYEASGGFGVEETTLDRSILDYLRKWHQFGWSYRDVFRHVPCISIPDDHDVYHGNVWGEGGEAAIKEGGAAARQDSGGFKMHPDWVTMVQHTQTSHLPDPYDPTPVKQGIGVYYTHWNWGPLSFAIIEDRKFKSAPLHIFPKEAKIRNGFISKPDFKDESYLNAPNAELLGARQEQFLEEWVQDWKQGAKMKILLSQTNFCTVGTLPKGSLGDDVVPSLAIPELGQYVSGDDMTRDMDSNGWPHSKRNKAVDIIRKGFTLHLAGDQHLGSVVHYGVEEFGDAGFAFAGPALNNIWPRRWWPTLSPNHKPLEGKPLYTGNFEDGFKNKITLHAVASPRKTGLKPAIIHDRATGYGVVLIDPETRDITFECWKRSADPENDPSNGQYIGWPITINQQDNYGKKALGYLSEIEMNSANLVVQLINETTKAIEYTVRLNTSKFIPKVFSDVKHTVRIGDPDKNNWKELNGLTIKKNKKRISVNL